MLRRLFTRIFSLRTLFSNQFTALLSPSAEYSQGISKPFPAPRSIHSIASNFTADITVRQTKKHFHPQAETSQYMSNHSSIFYHGYGIFIFHISWLVPAFKAFSYHWCPYFLVHMKTTNIRFKSVFFCPFVTHALLLFVSYKHMHCLSTESEAPWKIFNLLIFK